MEHIALDVDRLVSQIERRKIFALKCVQRFEQADCERGG